MLFEVCLQSVAGAVAAEAGGAGRVELCANLIEGGTTPSLATIEATLAAINIPTMVMIRPRGGDFLYSDRELDVMLRDVALCREAGAYGVVFGCLNRRGDVARPQVQRLIQEAGEKLRITFHRAFDVCRDPMDAQDELIELGVDRILSSGQAPTVPAGRELLRELVKRGGERITMLPGCGLTPENVAENVRYLGVQEFHATAFVREHSRMEHRNEAVYMGLPGLPEFERDVTGVEEVRRFVRAVQA